MTPQQKALLKESINLNKTSVFNPNKPTLFLSKKKQTPEQPQPPKRTYYLEPYA